MSEELTRVATEAAAHAYAPYSRFRVGAAVMGRSGRVYAGSNVENASSPAGVCAERVALGSGVSQGERQFEAIVVVFAAPDSAPSPGALVPCGICLQWLAELAPGAVIHVPTTGRTFAVADLLPAAFRLGGDVSPASS